MFITVKDQRPEQVKNTEGLILLYKLKQLESLEDIFLLWEIKTKSLLVVWLNYIFATKNLHLGTTSVQGLLILLSS